MNSDSIQPLADFFYQGKYKEVLQLYSELTQLTPDHHIFAIGSLAFSVDIQKALILFQSEESQWNASQKAECHFYLTVGCARLSKYNEARAHLQYLIRLRNQFITSRDRFFLFQGLGFFCYINGKLRSTARWAERSQ